MDEEYQYYGNENYATIGHAPAQPWEILPIWLYLVSLTTTNPPSKKETQKLTPPTDRPPFRLRRPPSLHPLPLQTHPPNPLPHQPLARVQQPRGAAIRPRKRPADRRTSARRPIDPLVRRVQRRGTRCGGHARALCEREDGGVDPRECVERGGGGGFCDFRLDDGAEGDVCW
jgi:hypothetical protein